MNAFVTYAIGLPVEIKAAIAIGVMFLVRLALAGRVPDRIVTELAGIITTAVVAVIELALVFIPPEFEAVAAAVLQLIVVLLGSVLAVRAYLVVKHSAQARGIRL